MLDLLPDPKRLYDVIGLLHNIYFEAPIAAYSDQKTAAELENLAFTASVMHLGYHFLNTLNKRLTVQDRALCVDRAIEIAENNAYKAPQGLLPEEEVSIAVNKKTDLTTLLMDNLQQTMQMFADNYLPSQTYSDVTGVYNQDVFLLSFCKNFISTAQRAGLIDSDIAPIALESAYKDLQEIPDPYLVDTINANVTRIYKCLL